MSLSSASSLVVRKLLGEEVLKCRRKSKGEENGKNGESSPAAELKHTKHDDADEYEEERVPVSAVLGGEAEGGEGGAGEGGDGAVEGGKVLGLYFCASWCPPCMTFRPQLEAFYRNVRKGSWEKGFEMVTVSTDEEEVGFRMTFRGSPWFALPFRDRERKARLRRRYRVRGVPTLVLIDAETGRAITGAGRDHVLHDPEANGFPWRPRSLLTVLSEGALIDKDDRRHNYNLRSEDEDENEEGTVHGLYFSANWCPPCKAFTPQLAETYRRVRERGHKFEVIFVSSDRSEESFSLYHSTMPWAAVPFDEESRRRELATVLGVQGIPTLVLLDSKGNLITDEGRVEVNDDPEGLNFPWHPRLVNTLTDRHASLLSDYPAVILFVEGEDSEIEFAESVLLPAAEEYKSKHREEDDICLQFFIGCDSEPIDTLREYVGIDDAVPLLTVIDMAARKVCVMEDGAEITEESVKAFVNKFLIGALPVAEIRDSPSPYEQQPRIVPPQPATKAVPTAPPIRANQEV